MVSLVKVDDFERESRFFKAFFADEEAVVVNKFVLVDHMLNEPEISLLTLEAYFTDFFALAKGVLSAPKSLKPEVRMAVQLLRRIRRFSLHAEKAKQKLDQLYNTNPFWAEYRQEELAYRHQVLNSSFSERVSNAIKNKDYSRVVRMISRYEDELPPVLKRKLDYCRKKEQ